jgi:hypothetical protein
LNHLLPDELFKWKKTHMGWGVVEHHMLLWGVVRKVMCFCWFMLGFKKEGILINHKPNNYY